MLEYQLVTSYMAAFVGRWFDRARDDERGALNTVEQLVLIVIGMGAAGTVAYIVWQNMKDGASETEFQTPNAP